MKKDYLKTEIDICSKKISQINSIKNSKRFGSSYDDPTCAYNEFTMEELEREILTITAKRAELNKNLLEICSDSERDEVLRSLMNYYKDNPEELKKYTDLFERNFLNMLD